jgi:hypothetical protein
MMHTPAEFFDADCQPTAMYPSQYRTAYSDEYDEEMLMLWQFGCGPAPPLHYSAVQIHDVPSAGENDLLGIEKVVRYEELTNWGTTTCGSWPNRSLGHTGTPGNTSLGYTPSSTFNKDGKASKHLLKLQRGHINPTPGAVFCTSDAFKLIFASKVADSDIESWRYFASKGLDIFWCGQKAKVAFPSVGRRQIIQKFRVSLRPGSNAGFVQFFQAAKEGLKNTKGGYPYGTIATYFVYRGPESSLDKEWYPSLLSVFPQACQTYVPMRRGQTLQLILPETYTYSVWGKLPEAALLSSGSYKAVGRFDCHYFKYVRDIADGYPIFFASRETPKQGVVIVPPIEERGGKRYAVLHAPLNNMILYTNGIDGFVFRTIEDTFRDRQAYLDRTFKLKIESHYRFSSVYDNEKAAYDLCVGISDKNLTQLEITNLFDGDVCKVKATKTC